MSTVNNIVNKRIDKLEKRLLSTINDTVNKKISETLTTDKFTTYDSVDIKEIEVNNTVNDTVDENKLSLTQAFELAQSRGYQGEKKTFSGVFTKHKNDLEFSFHDIKRNQKEGKEKVTYTDVYTVCVKQ